MRKALETTLRTTLAFAILAPLLISVSAACIVMRMFGAKNRQVDWAYQVFSEVFLFLEGGPVFTNGTERIGRHSFIVVSNHESNLDPFLIMGALDGLSVRFVIKRELIRIPVFGIALRLSGNVVVSRQGGRDDVRSVQSGVAGLEDGISLLFFAEGTRSRDGALRPFKKGAFSTAIAAGLPILPIGIAGTHQAVPPGKACVRGGALAIEVGEPIAVEGRSLDDRNAVLEEAFASVSALRSAARDRLRKQGYEPGGVD